MAIIKLLFFSGLFIPLIQVRGDDHIQIEVNQPYKDEGAKASYRFHDYSDNVVVASDLNTDQLGTYTTTYTFDEFDKSVERTIDVVDTTPPVITLKGPENLRVFEFTQFEDPGIEGFDNYDKDITDKITIENQVDMSKQGNYEIMYTLTDSSSNTTTIKRNVEVCEDPTNVKVFYNHDMYDNKAEEWWFHKSKDHQRMPGSIDETKLKDMGAYFQGPDEKVIYLTFDEGGNDITYIKEIADVLNDNGVTATFFLTRNYILNEADFINELVEKGHVVANHSWHHYDMTTLANANDIDKFVLEITETEKTYMQVTGKEMKKVFRFPKGGASPRAMQIVKDLGYTTYFWSHAYYDFASDVSGEEALKTLMDHYHNGAIYLLHPSNKGNYQAMDKFVKNMKELGYTFKTVDAIQEAPEIDE